jgi:hypothetical protein
MKAVSGALVYSGARWGSQCPFGPQCPDPFSPHFHGTRLREEQGREGTALSTRDDYRQNAVECLRLARSTPNASDRSVLVNMAQTWRRLEEQAAAISCLAELAAVEGGMKP